MNYQRLRSELKLHVLKRVNSGILDFMKFVYKLVIVYGSW